MFTITIEDEWNAAFEASWNDHFVEMPRDPEQIEAEAEAMRIYSEENHKYDTEYYLGYYGYHLNRLIPIDIKDIPL